MADAGKTSQGANYIQYCAKIIRANFDEFRLLFSRTFDEISAIFRANFRTVLAIIRRKFGEISQGHSKIRKVKRNIEQARFRSPEISKRFR